MAIVGVPARRDKPKLGRQMGESEGDDERRDEPLSSLAPSFPFRQQPEPPPPIICRPIRSLNGWRPHDLLAHVSRARPLPYVLAYGADISSKLD